MPAPHTIGVPIDISHLILNIDTHRYMSHSCLLILRVRGTLQGEYMILFWYPFATLPDLVWPTTVGHFAKVRKYVRRHVRLWCHMKCESIWEYMSYLYHLYIVSNLNQNTCNNIWYELHMEFARSISELNVRVDVNIFARTIRARECKKISMEDISQDRWHHMPVYVRVLCVCVSIFVRKINCISQWWWNVKESSLW